MNKFNSKMLQIGNLPHVNLKCPTLSSCFWRCLHMKRREAYRECFRMLGIPDCADQSTVRQAYLDLVKRVHPDAGSSEASSARFQQVDKAFKLLQEKFARERRNIPENEEAEMEFDIQHKVPQHRQYLSNEGIGIGTPTQRQKQYQKVRAIKAQEQVFKHRLEKAAAGNSSLMPKQAIKPKYGIERVVEDLIQEAMSKGQFNNLLGAGKPLSSNQTQNPYVDFTTHKLNKIMLDNGFTPKWITLGRDIRLAIDKLKKELRSERINYGEWPLETREEKKAWDLFAQHYKEHVEELNKMIDKYNLIVPIRENQFVHLQMDKMAERVFKEANLKHNVKRSTEVRNESENMAGERKYMVKLFSFIGRFL